MIEFETDARLGLGQFGIETGVVNPEQGESAMPEQDGHTVVYGNVRAAAGAGAPAVKRRAVLLVAGRRLLVGPAGATIGRSRQCDVVVEDPNVSRQHAEVRPRANGWVLVDLGSTNGSVLNGRLIERPETLEPGDTIEVGTSVITFDVE